MNYITKMKIAEAKNEIIRVRSEINQVQSEFNKIDVEYRRILREQTDCENKRILCRNKKRKLIKELKELETIIESENMFDSVQNVEGFNILLPEELRIISDGMDRTDYRNMPLLTGKNIARWYDLERLVKEVIGVKNAHPGWILKMLRPCGQYDTLPQKTFYQMSYETPEGFIVPGDVINITKI